MSNFYYARAIAVEVGNETMIGIEIPQEAIEKMGLMHGQMLEVKTEGDSLVFTKTGIIQADVDN